jgi:DNA-binding NarL/FixJ family response regulator
VEVCVAEITEGLLGDAVSRLGAARQAGTVIAQFESPHLIMGLTFLGLGRFIEAKRQFAQARADAVGQGVAFAAACAYAGLAEVGSRLGEWEAAWQNADECAEHYQQLGLENQCDALYVIALTRAQRGDVDEARSIAERGAAIATREGQELWGAGNRSVLGSVELSLGNASAAVSYLRPPTPSAALDLWHFPIYHDLLVNAVEALVGTDDLMAASDLLDALEQRGRKLDNAWERATRARCRGLICAAQGNADEARRAFGAALDEHDHTSTPLDRARTLLALGRLQRRLHAKRDSRSSLEEALDIFDALGASRWAEQARTELKRIGGRAPSRDALTPTESRVAELAAQGRTNKEIAAELVVTVKSVEAHLTRIYAKLGIRSRTELTRLLSQQRE